MTGEPVLPLLVHVVATSVTKLTTLTPVGLKARNRAARAHIPVTCYVKFRHRSFVPPRVGFTKALIPSRRYACCTGCVNRITIDCGID